MVTLDDHLQGYESGGVRQIDVSIRQKLDGYDVLVVVQARDRSSPADINAVGEFASVIRDVQASKGVLVCRSGFTARAKKYAGNIGIELLNLHDAGSRDWHLEIRIPILWMDLSPRVEYRLLAKLEGGDSLPFNEKQGFALSGDDGATVINALATFERHWNEGTIPQTPGGEHVLREPKKLSVLVDTGDGRRVWKPVDDFGLVYVVEERAWLGYISPEVCRGIVDYLQDEAFFVSHLPLGQIPTERDESWLPIDDPQAIVVSTRGTLVTSEVVEVLIPGSGRAEGFHYQYIGPESEGT